MLPHLLVDGVRVPGFLYGTAWKEDATESWVRKALDAGFRGIDTANQRKHYFEAGVGAALRAWQGDEIFIQTKFTYRRGQDERLPYDPNASVGEQVRQSLRSSLEHLGLQRVDSLVLHGPSKRHGLDASDREAWNAMEALVDEGLVRLLGVSNVSAEQLALFVGLSKRPLAFVQNRCYARQGWDRSVREVCKASGVIYQGFSLLTANPEVLRSNELHTIAARHECTPQQAVFRMAVQLGILPLTGTCNVEHMRSDLAIGDLALSPDEVARLEALAG